MDNLMYRNCSIAESNLGPNRHPASNKFEEWSDNMSEQIASKRKPEEIISEEMRSKRLEEIENVVANDMKRY